MKTRLQRPKLISFFLAFLLTAFSSVFAQESNNVKKQFCFTDELLSRSIEENPQLIEKLNEMLYILNKCSLY